MRKENLPASKNFLDKTGDFLGQFLAVLAGSRPASFEADYTPRTNKVTKDLIHKHGFTQRDLIFYEALRKMGYNIDPKQFQRGWQYEKNSKLDWLNTP